MNSDIENKEELKISSHDDGSIEVWSGSCGEHIRRNEEFPCVHDALTYCINIESELATTNEALRVANESINLLELDVIENAEIDDLKHNELETLKATVFNVQDVVDWAKNTIHHKSKCGSHDCIYVDELINYLNQLPQATDNKDGEEND